MMSHKITETLINFLNAADTSDKFTGGKTENSKQVPDAAGGSGEDNKFQAVFNKTSKDVLDYSLAPGGKLYYDFSPKIERGSMPSGGTIPVFLAFIVFIIGFISRKGIEGAIIINKIIASISKALCWTHKALLIAGRNYEKQ